MEQIIVKETGAGAVQDDLKLLLGAFLVRRADRRVELGGQGISLPGIAVRYGGFEGPPPS